MIVIKIPDHLEGVERTRFYQREYKRAERLLFPERARANYNRYSARHRKERSAWQKSHRDIINASRRARWWKDLENSRKRQRAAGRKTYYQNHEFRKSKAVEKRARRRSLTAFNESVALFIIALRDDPEATCTYCEKAIAGQVHIDHILPLSRGGKHSINNLCASCQTCNASKGNRTLAEWAQMKRSNGTIKN